MRLVTVQDGREKLRKCNFVMDVDVDKNGVYSISLH